MNTARIFTRLRSLPSLGSTALLLAALPLAGCGGDDTPGVLPAPAATAAARAVDGAGAAACA